MPRFRTVAALSVLLASSGCRRSYPPPETPMPPKTILLSEMMRELSAQPGFTEAMLHQLGGNGTKKGPALMTPRLVDELRSRILGKDWSGLDRFPGWTMREINPTVRAAGHVAGKDETLEDASAVHPGAPLGTSQDHNAPQHLDVGPYALDRAQTVSLHEPSALPGFTTQGIVSELGDGITRGDGPNALAREHAESQRLADVLNRLAANKLDGSQAFQVMVPLSPPGVRELSFQPATTPEQVIQLLQSAGHSVTVTDSRYFANFGHFHYKGMDVMMPFWIDSQILVPGSGGRHLLIPVAHAELEWHVRPAAGARGPLLNADVAYYFGIDGKSEWRTMDTLDQAWVLKRDAHTWTGDDAVEVTRLAGALTVAYMHLHEAHPQLPFGGYYALGVCQDGVSAIEHKMTGKTTLFPNTADDSFFTDPRDAEVNGLIAAIPKDRAGKRPEPERIFGSIPIAPKASGSKPFAEVTIPGLAEDLNTTYAAWQSGKLRRPHTWVFYAGLGVVLGTLLLLLQRRRGQR